MNRFDNDLQSRLSLDQHTGALSLGAGLQGQVFKNFAWDAYYTHGETRTQLTTRNNVDTARFYAAVDAVRDPATGNIVCNVSLTAPGAFPGCVPLNLFGQSATMTNGSNASQAALEYVGNPPTYWVAHNGLDDFGANLTGTAFDDGAGPVKVAVGAEYRLASLVVTTSTPDNSFNPQNLRLAPPGTFAPTAASPAGNFPPADLSYFKEVQAPARGSENISEVSAEFDAPLLRGLPLIELLSVNGAARYTQYSTGGQSPTSGTASRSSFSASTWKLGGTWQVTDDLRVRGARSRDIRAPTLWDLYQGAVVTTSGVSDGLVTGVSGSVNTQSVGNPALKPEVAHNSTAGLIYTPGWLAGFSVSADYFHIDIDNEIAGVSGNTTIVQALCLASSGGSSPYCNLIQRPISYNSTDPTNYPTLFYSQGQNSQRQWTEGVDFEIDYESDLNSWTPLTGMLNLRLLWTHTSFLKTLGLPGAVVTDAAGANEAPGTALPNDKASLMMGYTFGGLSVDLLERYYASVRQSANPSLVFDIPDLPAYYQTDINIAYLFEVSGVPFTGFLNVSNLLDAQPGILQVPSYAGSPGVNYPVVPYEDIIGRYFTVGLRFKM
jgi:iron complex outermembrane receptor protein